MPLPGHKSGKKRRKEEKPVKGAGEIK